MILYRTLKIADIRYSNYDNNDLVIMANENGEKIARNLPTYTRDLSLTCYPAEKDQPIYINVSYDFVPEDFIKKCKEGYL